MYEADPHKGREQHVGSQFEMVAERHPVQMGQTDPHHRKQIGRDHAKGHESPPGAS